jgi:cellobiose-specific phosphotransferase system component IIC
MHALSHGPTVSTTTTAAPQHETATTELRRADPRDATAQFASILAAATVVAYSITFALYVKRGYGWAQKTSSSLLLVGGLLAVPVLVAVWRRTRIVDETLATTAALLGAGGAFGACVHGAYDIANFVNPTVNPTVVSDGAFPVDPRGFATFGLSGLALVIMALLGSRAGLSRRLAKLGAVTGLVTIAVFIGRLTVLDPNTGWVALCAALAGLVGTPMWYLGLSRWFAGESPTQL